MNIMENNGITITLASTPNGDVNVNWQDGLQSLGGTICTMDSATLVADVAPVIRQWFATSGAQFHTKETEATLFAILAGKQPFATMTFGNGKPTLGLRLSCGRIHGEMLSHRGVCMYAVFLGNNFEHDVPYWWNVLIQRISFSHKV